MNSRFSARSTTDEVLQGIDLDGRIALVTGATSGIGTETARALASAGAEVLITGRSREAVETAREGIIRAVPGASIGTLIMDLADLDSVRRAAARLPDRTARIDILVNNAGIMACPQACSREGCELQFATNHIGHFLFSCLLAPALIAAGAARVVTLSSSAHKYTAVDFDDLHFRHKPYDKWLAYGQSKTANILFALEFGRRLQHRGVRSFAVHPGVIATNLIRHLDEADFKHMRAESAAKRTRMVFKTIPQGAATSVWAATSPGLADQNGLYLEDCGIAAEVAPGNYDSGYLAYARDGEAARRLWQVSEEIVGERFAW